MNPKYPIYIISKNRWESRQTSKALELINTPYHIVIEPQEYDKYVKVIDAKKILVLPFSNLGEGSIPARNWVWEHSISIGAERHWILDDNISRFFRLNQNLKVPVSSGTIFKCAEDFVDRYENIAISGFHYEMFAPRKNKLPPFYLNTRIYSCILIKNDIPYKWRGRYNEDTDLSIRTLQDGWCTILFNAFLADKTPTMTMKGGNTDELYQGNNNTKKEDDGRWKMAESLRLQHPNIVKVTRKWGRWQHHVDYSLFKKNKLILKPDIKIKQGVDNYGMVLKVYDKNPDLITKKDKSMLLIQQKPLKLLDDFLQEYNNMFNIDIVKAKEIIKQTISYYKNDKNIDNQVYVKHLENIWYDSLSKNKINYSVYNDEYYFTDLWVCWVLYSRNYLKSIIKDNSLGTKTSIYNKIKNIESIVDLGCGIGYTTASLKQIFSKANIYGYNIKNTKQYEFCQMISKKYNFDMISDLSNIDNIDMVFASEYFEHLEDPINHLVDIIDKLNPKYMFVANSFNTYSVGHFIQYQHNDNIIDQKNMSKLFNSILIGNGYKKVKTKLWNNKPTLWEKLTKEIKTNGKKTKTEEIRPSRPDRTNKRDKRNKRDNDNQSRTTLTESSKSDAGDCKQRTSRTIKPFFL